ncbi:MAG: hypothetical protein AAB807_00505 [Patescibacteria group bacterium]
MDFIWENALLNKDDEEEDIDETEIGEIDNIEEETEMDEEDGELN